MREEERKRQKQLSLQAKRTVKEEEARLREERDRERQEEERRIEEARQYYRRGLLIRYGIVPLCRAVEATRDMEVAADQQYIKWIKVNALENLKLGHKE